MGDKGEDAIVGDGHENLVDALREGHSIHIGENLLIILESLIETILLQFGDREDFGVVHFTVVLFLDIEDRVELVIEFWNLAKKT